MDTVTSRDGTAIVFDRLGDGPPVVLVSGGSTDRMANAGLAAELARDHTVYNYDRRGRGDSGDTLPYAIEREVEDIAAVIEEAGGTANLYGTSSGAALAMHAAAAGLPVTRLALWEPPYSVGGRPDLPDDTASVYRELVEAGRRGDAVEYFMSKVVGLPPDFVEGAKQQPFWAATEALAHTLAYDARIMSDYRIPVDRAAGVNVPTLVIAGGADMPWMRDTAAALADALSQGQVLFLDDQGHDVDPTVLAPVLKGFFAP
jgi:pimeloyl-ACP methyl ester carboxylesterase